jgi:hypothetical protein
VEHADEGGVQADFQALERYNQGEMDLAQIKAFTEPKLEDALDIADELIGIIRLDATHQVVSQVGAAKHILVDSRFNPADWVSDQVVFSSPFVVNGHHWIIVSAPIINRQGERQGTDLVIADMASLESIVSGVGVEGRTDMTLVPKMKVGFLKNGSGYSLFTHESDRHEKIHFSLQNDSEALSPDQERWIKRAVEGENGVIQAGESTTAFAPVEHAPWGVLLFQDAHVLYAGVYAKLASYSGVAFGIYLLLLGGFWLVMKPLAGKLIMHADELEQQIQEAKATIKQLDGLLPICASCKKIRDDKGYWSEVETYIHEHTEADFSHGICPDCAKKLYPGFKGRQTENR